MLEAEPRYALSKARLTALRQAMQDHMPLIEPTLAIEAVARGLGYSDYAKLVGELAGADAIRSVDGSAATRFLSQHGIAIEPSLVHHVLATFAIREVLDARFGMNELGVELPVRPGEQFRNGLRERMNEHQHAQSRARMASPCQAPGQLRALAFASLMTPSASYACSDRLSDYKHAAEGVAYELSDGTALQPVSVSHGNMAAALHYAGYAVNGKNFFKVSASGFREFQAAAGLPYFFRGKWQIGTVPREVHRATA
jgi:hypothetical protein